jgi:hypothetical protein
MLAQSTLNKLGPQSSSHEGQWEVHIGQDNLESDDESTLSQARKKNHIPCKFKAKKHMSN